MKIFEILIARRLDKGGLLFLILKEEFIEKFPYNYEKNSRKQSICISYRMF